MAGRLFAVVGPSGAGKDTLMAAVQAARPDVHLVRRVITRPSDAGGEDFDGVSEAAFAAQRAEGHFALWWQAHGLSYGIPANILDQLAQDHHVLFNASRAALPEARRLFPDLQVIHVTAPEPVLAERLAARGRESAQDIAHRLKRADYALPEGLTVHHVQNDGPIEQAVAYILPLLQPESR